MGVRPVDVIGGALLGGTRKYEPQEISSDVYARQRSNTPSPAQTAPSVSQAHP